MAAARTSAPSAARRPRPRETAIAAPAATARAAPRETDGGRANETAATMPAAIANAAGSDGAPAPGDHDRLMRRFYPIGRAASKAAVST